MKVKKEYTFTNNRVIWRVVPAEPGNLVIEDRNIETKEAFFSCIEVESGKEIFRNLQLDEKYWIGIEAVYQGIIYFNKYIRPDMPRHKDIIAFDIKKQQILWHNPDLIFLFIDDGKLYCYKQGFEDRTFFALDYITGQIVEELGNNAEQVNLLRVNASVVIDPDIYRFPESYFDKIIGGGVDVIINKVIKSHHTAGAVQFILFNSILLINTFEPGQQGQLNNYFRGFDVASGKLIFEELLTANARAVVPDSFFMRNNFILLLKEKTKLVVCSVKN